MPDLSFYVCSLSRRESRKCCAQFCPWGQQMCGLDSGLYNAPSIAPVRRDQFAPG